MTNSSDATYFFSVVARRFKALSDPLRLKILWHLRQKEWSVGELARELGASQPNVSKHLAVLTAEQIIDVDSRGAFRFYRLVDESIFTLCELVCSQVEQSNEVFSRLAKEFHHLNTPSA